MVIWARKFYESRQQWPQLPWCEQLPPYLDNLKKKGVQQWQIVQAELAVRVYFTNYLTSACKETTSPSSISFTEVNDKKFARILENFKEILRLRNYARKTEKTYLYWSKQLHIRSL